MFAWNAQFSIHRGWLCAAPNALPDAGLGGAPKGTSPGLGGGADSFFLFRAHYVGKTLKSVNVCLQCPVFNASRLEMASELRLLKLLPNFFPFDKTSIGWISMPRIVSATTFVFPFYKALG